MKNESIIQVGDKSYIKAKVVMLPTEKSRLTKGMTSTVQAMYWRDEESSVVKDGAGTVFVQPHHLYFLSDEEIKEGDWHYDSSDGKIKQWKGNLYSNRLTSKKIIASTDELGIGNNYGSIEVDNKIVDCNDYLPRPSNEFLQAYCKASGKIDEVLIEWLELRSSDGYYDKKEVWHWKMLSAPKVSPDNTITIKKVEEKMYSREEVEILIHKAFKGGYERSHSGYPNTDNHTKPKVDKWIEENL